MADRSDGRVCGGAPAQRRLRLRAADDPVRHALAGELLPGADVRSRAGVPRRPPADGRVQHPVRTHFQHERWQPLRLHHADDAGVPALAMLGLVLALLAAAPAERWSLYGGETVAPGVDVFGGEIGWPSTSLGWTHGLTDTTDAGVRLDVLYALETTTETHFGLGLRVPVRAIAVRTGAVSLLVRGDPGLKVYPGNGTPWGLAIPVSAVVGIAVRPELRLGLGVDVPITFFFAPSAQVVIGTQFG